MLSCPHPPMPLNRLLRLIPAPESGDLLPEADLVNAKPIRTDIDRLAGRRGCVVGGFHAASRTTRIHDPFSSDMSPPGRSIQWYEFIAPVLISRTPISPSNSSRVTRLAFFASLRSDMMRR